MTKENVTSINSSRFARLGEYEQLREATRALQRRPRDLAVMGEYLDRLDVTYQFGHNWVFDTALDIVIKAKEVEIGRAKCDARYEMVRLWVVGEGLRKLTKQVELNEPALITSAPHWVRDRLEISPAFKSKVVREDRIAGWINSYCVQFNGLWPKTEVYLNEST
jgi:hypothetical protein